jgi:HEPN domain-containing protein
MNNKQKIKYWIDIADYDLKTAHFMQKSRRYLHTVFMCQQAIEKILKALYLQIYLKEAPFTHNLIYLQSLLNIKLNQDQQRLLAELNTYYIEGRYPSYKNKLSTLIDKKKSTEILRKSKIIYKCIKSTIN